MRTRIFSNPRAKRVTKPLGDLGGLQHLGFHLTTLPVGSVASEFHRHVCAEECVYIIAGNGTARIGPDMFEIEAGDFIALPADGEAHDLRNTGSLPMTCIIVGQSVWILMLLTIQSKINVSIAMLEKRGTLSILPLSATRFCQMRVGDGCLR